LNKENRYEVSVLNITGNLTLGESFDDVLTVTTGRLNISDGDIKAAGNLTLAERITFSLGSIIDNLVSGFLRITGGLNVTESLIVTGNVSLGATNRTITITSDKFNVSNGSLDLSGGIEAGGGLNVSGDLSFNQQLNITALSGNLVTAGTIGVSGSGDSYILGNVGIGTTSPQEKLTVIGMANFTGGLIANDTLFVNGSMVGIGTTTPSAKLEVVSSGVDDQGFMLRLSKTVSGTGENYIKLVGDVQEWDIGIRENPGNYFSIGRSGIAYDFVINQNGSVGIGTTTPTERLVVMGNLSINHSAGTSSTLFVDSTSGNVGIGTSSPATTLDVKGKLNVTGNTSIAQDTLFVDNTSSRVGIGTASPTQKLHVIGDVNISGDLKMGANNIDFTTTRITEVSAGELGIRRNTGAVDVNLQVYGIKLQGGGLIFSSSTGIIDATGNVGIGTTTPNYKLDVRGNVSATGAVNFTNNTYFNQTLFVIDGRVGIGTSSPATTLDIDSNSNTQALRIRGAAETTEVADIYVDTAGNLVLDTTAGADSAQYIDLKPEDDSYGLILRESDGTGTATFANFYVVDAATDYMNIILNDVQSTTGLVVTESGNVGIGQTSPNVTLGVSGDINASGTIWALGINLSTTAGGWTDDGSVTRLTTATDLVGIGTASPGAKLEVVGNLSVNGSIDIIDTNGSLYQSVYGTDDDLVLYLPFNAPNGSIQYDRSPYGNDGTLYGGINCNVSLGKYGAGCEFDGSTSYINTSFAETDPTTFTAEAWIKPDDVTRGGERIISHGGLPPTDNGWSIQQNNGELRLTFHGIGNYDSNGDILINDVWQHVAVTLQGTTATFYRNGVQSGTASTASMGVGTHVYSIGATPVGANPFNGSIDEVRIYKRALSAEEIRTHYLRGKGYGASGAITADKFRIVNTSGAKTLVLNQTAFSILNTSGSGGLFYVDKANNRVGIGTTAPGRQLHIVSNTAEAELQLESTVTNGRKWTLFSGGGGAISAGKFGIHDQTAQTNRFTIDEGGKVGINTTTPSGLFHVTDAKGDLMFDAGRVGIGTTSPATKLDVKGKTNFTGNFSVGQTSNILFVDNTSGRVGVGTSSPNRLLDVAGNMEANIYYDADDGSYYLDAASTGTSGVFAGDVGIGDTTPSDALEVVGNVRVSGSLNATAINATRLNINNTLFVDDSRVGIGTASPGSQLEVSSSADSTELRITADDGYNPQLRLYGGNNYWRLIHNDDGTNRFDIEYDATDLVSITTLGNVGIGNIIPNATLDVSGNIYLSAANPMINMSGPIIRKSGNDIVISD
jgi:hypothetical protein